MIRPRLRRRDDRGQVLTAVAEPAVTGAEPLAHLLARWTRRSFTSTAAAWKWREGGVVGAWCRRGSGRHGRLASATRRRPLRRAAAACGPAAAATIWAVQVDLHWAGLG
jgi:hypothetical protein